MAAEWLYESGIGEDRAALVDQGRIVKARTERHDSALRLGTVAQARLVERPALHLALVEIESERALLSDPPRALTLGQRFMVEVVREALVETDRDKLAKVVPAEEGAVAKIGPGLLERIAASGIPARRCLPHEADHFAQAGWDDVIGEAADLAIPFPGGMLRLALTPAMTLFDVDGGGPLDALARAAAAACADAIVRHGIGGSIGIDFPTLQGRDARQAVAAVIDARLPQPFERTAVNGFGFLQIVRRRTRPSLPETLRADPAATATLRLLRSLERAPPPIARAQVVPKAVARTIDAHPQWREELARRTGVNIRFKARDDGQG